jgi:hypothetical protein
MGRVYTNPLPEPNCIMISVQRRVKPRNRVTRLDTKVLDPSPRLGAPHLTFGKEPLD